MSGLLPGDEAWMRRALELARRGWGRTAPNPMVGCVIVRDGRVVGEGWHAEYGGPHAEVEALRAAGDAAHGATAYVTLEPCAHHGKTPPCTQALIAAGIGCVVFAVADPDPEAGGGGEVLRAAGIESVGGVEKQAARDQNAVFFHAHSSAGASRPFVALKLALSADARVADRDGRSMWITGEEARAETHRLRSGFDAVAVGIGTALADDPRLTARGPVIPRIAPTRVVFDRTLRLPPTSTLAATTAEAPVIAVTAMDAPTERAEALEAAGVRVMRVPDGIERTLETLRQAGIRSMFVEGGAELAGSLLRAGVVDRLYLFYAPLFLGPEGLSPFDALESPPIDQAPRWRRIQTAAFGADTLVTLARE
ncbi:MAG TPA: bifunctional diaminohydroxyphosphoribosylaminopyrimidine deaminase/5-amino-6-(5-phosphoribosylamino)uracil reductase RibD [Longimicrobium sp.]|jgi:diaminohydroxyphosphoribosylaminopyrimidine deaminase/5-amino-6-(5-phosphoribosylamino)uracil reductase|nr:bifunctional diaminohydroxyphosphoribosylaminopyrimidine deaminase/5-amino-6-(5-phosphoribosylamino)uracil reductase RibD [Longimicrobium sp.]